MIAVRWNRSSLVYMKFLLLIVDEVFPALNGYGVDFLFFCGETVRPQSE